MLEELSNRVSGYGKVWNYDDRPVREMFASAQRIEIEEKVDGSQFSFGMLGGQLRMRSKGQEVFAGNNCMFDLASETASGLFEMDMLKEGVVYRGEYIKKPKHNTLCYGGVPEGHIVLYEVEQDGESLWHEQVMAEGDRLGLPVSPLIYSGPLLPRDDIESLLDRDSFLGGCKIEGVVIKARNMRHLQDGKMLKAKVVAGWFKERHGKAWKFKNPGAGDIVEQIGASLETDARFAKTVQHLDERGELEWGVRDIGNLMKELGTDLYAEHSDTIKDELFKHFWPKIQRRANRGFVEWYKGQLRDKAEVTK